MEDWALSVRKKRSTFYDIPYRYNEQGILSSQDVDSSHMTSLLLEDCTSRSYDFF
jgi:hypothetical protein